jgi:hypothetical protein
MDEAKELVPLRQRSHGVKLYVGVKRAKDKGRNSYKIENLNRSGTF